MNTPYTLSIHFYGAQNPENHFDLFLDVGEDFSLLTYQIGLPEVKEIKTKPDRSIWRMRLSRPHRRFYMNYQGELGMNRGRLRVIRRGSISMPKKFDRQNPPGDFYFSVWEDRTIKNYVATR